MNVQDLDTPALVADRPRAEANLARAQAHCDALGLAMRPHVKTHKLPRWAHRQMALGAIGITCQKLSEAEAMAAAGLSDIFLPYNILGAVKLDRLATLNRRVRLSVTADSAEAVEGYAARFRGEARPLEVLVECDTGMGRCGVQSPDAAAALAGRIAAAEGLRLGGLMTYPPKGRVAHVDAWLAGARARLEAAGLPCPRVTSGGSPDLYESGGYTAITEYRPGTYIYSDRMQVAWGLGTLAECALFVLATVVSRPAEGRAVIDAGSKALAADQVPAPATGHGHVTEHPEATLAALSEEHGILDVSSCAAPPAIGDVVHVIPNHACVVSNLHDAVHLVEDGLVVDRLTIASRGALS
mgnify:CR=1 FL=1